MTIRKAPALPTPNSYRPQKPPWVKDIKGLTPGGAVNETLSAPLGIGLAGTDVGIRKNLAADQGVDGQTRLNNRLGILKLNSSPANQPPGGHILKAADLSQEQEQERVRANGGRGLLQPFGRYNADAEPVLIVHGINGDAADMQQLIDHYTKDPTKQVYVFSYDDQQRFLDSSANDLASELEKLRADHLGNKKPDVTIVSHSMGGLISQGALNTLANPRWYDDPSQYAAERGLTKPCADNFGQVRHISMDTPWRGYGPPPINLRDWLSKLGIQRSWMDVTANSDYLNKLYQQQLPARFINQHLEADYAAGGKELDNHKGWQRLDDSDIAALVEHFKGNQAALEGKKPLQNGLRALRRESDYKTLEPQLQRAALDGTLTREHLMTILGQGVGFVPGNHMSILKHPKLLDELDQLDHLEQAGRQVSV